MQQPKVTVVGSANVDLVIRAERMPTKGETLIGETFDIFTGGKGFNQATAAARLGTEVTLIGRIGADPFADILRSAIESEHINSRFVKTDVESGTGIATIVVEPDGDNSIIVVPRANMRLTSKDIADAADSIAEADVLLLQLETPIEASQTAINIAKANNTIVILDPAPARPLPPSLLAQVDILTPNATEAALLSGHAVNTLEEAIVTAETLQTQIATVVLTLGEQGVLLCTATQSTHIPALSVDAVDTTGAGDAFSGGLATALANGNDLSEAVRFAIAAGAAAVTVLGATPSMPTREKIEAILAKSC
ncbi:MAG: ribokinase [Candidatus Poribacteria bacterium]|nr:ribokinase [Candidatus Poribacteria bacterium]